VSGDNLLEGRWLAEAQGGPPQLICFGVGHLFSSSVPSLYNEGSRPATRPLSPLLPPQCDQIYHLACPASPKHYQYNPVKTIKTSALGTLNLLGLARARGTVFLGGGCETPE